MKNNFLNKYDTIICVFVSILLGVISFILIYGVDIINPTKVDWCMYHIDSLRSYFGWEFFRRAPWDFPLGIFNNLSYPSYTSILNTDSIPLFAILFKFFNKILPSEFQYFGIYGFLAVILQNVFGMLIIKKYTPKTILGSIVAIISGFLFSIVPLLFIFSFAQVSLMAHYLILLSFLPFLYDKNFSFKSKIIFFFLFGFFLSAIHPYFIVMIFIITLGYVIFSYFENKNLNIFFIPFAYILGSIIMLILVGGLSMNTINSADNLLVDSFNLNGFFNPMFNTSGFFQELKIISYHQIIGYSYFGIGAWIIILTAFIAMIFNKKILDEIKQNKIFLLVFLGLILISIFVALSPRVTFGDKILYEIKLPEFLLAFWSIFRATGRFIWVAYYMIIAFSMIYVIKKINLKCVFLLFIFCAILQTYELKNMFQAYHNIGLRNASYTRNVISKPIFQKIIKENNINHLIFEPEDGSYLPNYKKESVLFFFALKNNLKITNFPFCRMLKNQTKNYDFALNNPKPNELFVFFNEDNISKISNNKMILYKIEGFIFGSSNKLNNI